ncbi:PadR family transcriptional regulator [Paucibacter aquatile]|uniref:PadR family transcriptional regulator n=1 Tax=Kinneretia aquatilis TaxID=2070761 RepID=A0A2N8KZW1_9BURK|nr:PadR family transcriptional regulator [Paucibacter aquatile]
MFCLIHCTTRYVVEQGKAVENEDSQDKWQIQIRKGALELVILAALRGPPVYGLALLRHLQQFPTTAITEGTLYPLLDRLKRDELVSADWIQEGSTRPRKYYQLTAKGEQRLQTLAAAWQQSVADINALLTTPTPAADPRKGT